MRAGADLLINWPWTAVVIAKVISSNWQQADPKCFLQSHVFGGSRLRIWEICSVSSQEFCIWNHSNPQQLQCLSDFNTSTTGTWRANTFGPKPTPTICYRERLLTALTGWVMTENVTGAFFHEKVDKRSVLFAQQHHLPVPFDISPPCLPKWQAG